MLLLLANLGFAGGSASAAATDTGTKPGWLLMCRFVYVVSASGRTKWVDYIPVKQVSATGEDIGRYTNLGGAEVHILSSNTGLTAWVDYVPVVEVSDPDAGRWRFDNTGFIPIIGV